MPIPVVTEFRIPLLQLCGDGKDRTLMEAADELANVFHLTEQERAAVLPSNNYPVVRHRTGWASFHWSDKCPDLLISAQTSWMTLCGSKPLAWTRNWRGNVPAESGYPRHRCG